jgi:transitional endoplasmic reticulum ATPase
MQTARLYQPACVFFEDMDVVADPGTAEGDDITRLLDLFDGLTAKSTEIQVILTTNHVEKIHKGMTRPGRLDAIIEIGSLDGAGIEKLIKAVVPHDQLSDNIDWDKVVAAMSDSDGVPDFVPAFVKEAADRTRRYAIARTGGDTSDLELTTDDFVHAATGLRPHLDLMHGAKDMVERDPLSVVVKRDVGQEMEVKLRELIHPKFLVEDEA